MNIKGSISSLKASILVCALTFMSVQFFLETSALAQPAPLSTPAVESTEFVLEKCELRAITGTLGGLNMDQTRYCHVEKTPKQLCPPPSKFRMSDDGGCFLGNGERCREGEDCEMIYSCCSSSMH